MPKENNFNLPQDNIEFEDIRSSSDSKAAKLKRKAKKAAKPVVKYADGMFKYLGHIIKAIGFLIGFAIFGACLFVGYYLYSKDPTFEVISLSIVIAGIVIGMICMFLIFGLGHIVCQNNEILRRLNALKDEQHYY
ncbi:MAG: hypothetical protein E7562_08030 [Ruminococcaceae bacterium]|nr:hypothetical protein [Oscillospiraceae bacterium]